MSVQNLSQPTDRSVADAAKLLGCRPLLNLLKQPELPGTISLTETAPLVGVSRARIYKWVQEDDCPIPVLEVGGRKRVLTIPLLRLLGVEAGSADDSH